MSSDTQLSDSTELADSEPDAEEPPTARSGRPTTAAEIAVSIIIPVRNDPANLDLCLNALGATEHPLFEIIVVDDASTDQTPEIAERYGVRVLRQATQTGPAGARNFGAEEANFPFLFFVDADVCVRPDTVGDLAAQFAQRPDIQAFFGSYDAHPGAPNLLSQYRNLLHHFVHQSGNEDAFSFWSGCGAIERSVFLDLGGFDTAYDNASVEDIELGARLRERGHRIALVKSIQVKHMKRWTLWKMIHTDIQKRAIPWTLLLLRQGEIPNDLNLRHSQRLSALCAAGLVATLAIGSWYHPSMLILLLVPVIAMLLIDRWSMRRPVPAWGRFAVGVGSVAVAVTTLATTQVGTDLMQWWSALAVACLAGIILLNRQFYVFLVQAKRPLFAALILPVHVLYYLYSSLAFAVGFLMHLARDRS